MIPKPPKEVSECCGAELKTWTSDDSTSFWVCTDCDRACDAHPSETNCTCKHGSNGDRYSKGCHIHSETNEVDYLKEFDELDICVGDEWGSTLENRIKALLKSSIERARRERDNQIINKIQEMYSDKDDSDELRIRRDTLFDVQVIIAELPIKEVK